MLALETKKVMRRAPYRLFHESGKWKSCYRFEAIQLLKEGKWHDKTTYLKNEEVLSYEAKQNENGSSDGLQLKSKRGRSKGSSSKRQES